MSEEVWAPVVGSDRYLVSDHGQVWCCLKKRLVKPFANPSGHLRVHLDGRHRLVHNLVLEVFVGPCPPGMEGCHNDGDPTNNQPENLRWDTRAANMLDAVRHGTHQSTRRTHCQRGHELCAANNVPRSARRGRRECLACNRAYTQATNARQRRGEIVDDMFATADAHYARIMAQAGQS